MPQAFVDSLGVKVAMISDRIEIKIERPCSLELRYETVTIQRQQHSKIFDWNQPSGFHNLYLFLVGRVADAVTNTRQRTVVYLTC